MVDIEIKDFSWLEGMAYEDASDKILEHKPYYLYPYYFNGENMMMTDNLDFHRIHVRVENSIIIIVNGTG